MNCLPSQEVANQREPSGTGNLKDKVRLHSSACLWNSLYTYLGISLIELCGLEHIFKSRCTGSDYSKYKMGSMEGAQNGYTPLGTILFIVYHLT